VIGHDDAPVFGVRVPRACDVAVAELCECVLFPRFGLAPVDGQFACLVPEGGDGVCESATGLDFGELMAIADKDHFRPGRPHDGDEVMKVDGAAHPGLIDNHDGVGGEWGAGELVVETGDSERGDVGALVKFPGCPGGGCDADDVPSVLAVGGGDGVEGVGLTASCWSGPSDALAHATTTRPGCSRPVPEAIPAAIVVRMSVSRPINRRVV
jgi:hypothetical protein